MKTPLSLVPALLLGSLILAFPSCAADSGLRERLADAHAIGADHWIYGSVAESVGENGAFQKQAGESVTRGDRRRRELEAPSSSPPLASLLLESLAASGGDWWSRAIG